MGNDRDKALVSVNKRYIKQSFIVIFRIVNTFPNKHERNVFDRVNRVVFKQKHVNFAAVL